MVKEWKTVNFKLNEANVKMKWSVCHERGTKENSESPTGFEPYDLPKTGRGLYPLERRFGLTRVIYGGLPNTDW